MNVDPRTGRHYPSRTFAEWRNEMAHQLWKQRDKLGTVFAEGILCFKVDYYPADLRIRDMPGMMDALFHVLEQGGIVANDSQLKNCSGWFEHDVDKINPRLIIEISNI